MMSILQKVSEGHVEGKYMYDKYLPERNYYLWCLYILVNCSPFKRL